MPIFYTMQCLFSLEISLFGNGTMHASHFNRVCVPALNLSRIINKDLFICKQMLGCVYKCQIIHMISLSIYAHLKIWFKIQRKKQYLVIIIVLLLKG